MKIFLDKRNLKIILAFILSNVIAFLAILLLPAKAAEPNMLFISLVNLLFLNLIIVFSIVTYVIYPKPSHTISRKPIDAFLLNKNIKFLSFAPLAGILFIFFDRVILRGIDYSQGLRAARYAWLDTQGGNIVGIVGNLLVPFAYVSIYFLIIHFQNINKKYRFWLTLSAISGIIGHAALNGGRSNLLLGLTMIVIAFLLKQKNKQKIVTHNYSIKTKIIFFLIMYFSFLYVSHIIQSSASLGDISLSELLPLGMESLYGSPKYSFFDSDHLQVTYLFLYMLSYLYHGQWTAQIAYALPIREGSYATPPILYQLGFLDPSTMTSNYFAETGAFISFPGALFYDFGLSGVILLSSVLGVLLGFVFVIVSYSTTVGSLKMVFIVGILYILLLSPILPAYGLGFFNFILYAFVMLGIINTFIFKRKINFIG